MSENLIESKKKSISDSELKKLLELLNSINFGSVTLVIQDGKIVQMEKNEKLRLK
ncbi:MAG TPA: YezD family protein [Clostridia bacterium]